MKKWFPAGAEGASGFSKTQLIGNLRNGQVWGAGLGFPWDSPVCCVPLTASPAPLRPRGSSINS